MAITFRTFLEGIANATPAMSDLMMKYYVLNEQNKDRAFSQDMERRRTESLEKVYDAQVKEAMAGTDVKKFTLAQLEKNAELDTRVLRADAETKEALARLSKMQIEGLEQIDPVTGEKMYKAKEIEGIKKTRQEYTTLIAQARSLNASALTSYLQGQSLQLDSLIAVGSYGPKAQAAWDNYTKSFPPGKTTDLTTVKDFVSKNLNLFDQSERNALSNMINASTEVWKTIQIGKNQVVMEDMSKFQSLKPNEQRDFMKNIGAKDMSDVTKYFVNQVGVLDELDPTGNDLVLINSFKSVDEWKAFVTQKNEEKRRMQEAAARQKAEEDAASNSRKISEFVKQKYEAGRLIPVPTEEIGVTLVSRSYEKIMDAMSNVNPVDRQRFISSPQGTPTESKQDAIKRFFGGPR